MSTRSIDKKSIAKSLYMDGNYTQEEIADKVGTTRQTVGRWIKAESWDTLKASLSITPAQIISQWNRQIVEINKKINERPEGEPTQRRRTHFLNWREQLKSSRQTSVCQIVFRWPCAFCRGSDRSTLRQPNSLTIYSMRLSKTRQTKVSHE